MWYTERKGTLYCEDRFVNPVTGKTQVVSVKVVGKRKTEALQKLRKKIEDLTSSDLRLSSLISYYLKDQEKTCKNSTITRNKSVLDNVCDILNDPFVNKLTAGYVRKAFADSGKPNVTLNQYISRLKACMRWGYVNALVETNAVADKLQNFPDKTEREKVVDKFLEVEELNALLDVMECERWKLLTKFLVLSGLRIGEAMALNNDDIDDTYISVNKTDYNGEITSTKTMDSTREVYMQSELKDCVADVRKLMRKQQLMFGYVFREYFFVGPDGCRISYDAYRIYLDRCAKKAKIDKHVTPHCLRHTMTSLFAANGVSFEVIGRRLGHSDNSVLTKEIYFHVTEKLKEKQNEEQESSLFA